MSENITEIEKTEMAPAVQENQCPCCGKHCDLSAPKCERGEEYLRTGVIPPRKPKEGRGEDAHHEEGEGYRRHNGEGRHHGEEDRRHGCKEDRCQGGHRRKHEGERHHEAH